METKEYITVYLKGLAMGAADAVPGVSGGTIALITGIYDRLIDALTPEYRDLHSFLRHVSVLNFSELKKMIYDLDVPFLAVLGTGVLTSVVLVLNLVHYMIENLPVQTYAFFTGLIAASALLLYRDISFCRFKDKTAALTGFAFAFLASGYGAKALGHEPVVLMFSGAVAVSAMVLPGVSGSLMLVMLGQYKYISTALSNFTEAGLELFKTGNMEGLTAATPSIMFFVSGAVAGLFSVVNLVEKAFERDREMTMVFLTSMVVGALRAPLLQIEKVVAQREITWITVSPEFMPAALAGATLIYLTDRKTRDRKK